MLIELFKYIILTLLGDCSAPVALQLLYFKDQPPSEDVPHFFPCEALFPVNRVSFPTLSREDLRPAHCILHRGVDELTAHHRQNVSCFDWYCNQL